MRAHSRMAVEQRGTRVYRIGCRRAIREGESAPAIAPNAFLNEIQRTAYQCAEIVLDMGELQADSWDVARAIMRRFHV